MVGDIFHICNRGVEKRNIFTNDCDYNRFVDNLFLLNNKSGKIRTEKKNIFDGSGFDNSLNREKLVEILSWSLLPNHYHLLLYEVVEGGALEFVKRLGNAYTKYFNTKNDGRSGYLFQNSAKIIPIENDSQFLYIPFYIDLNPLDLIFPNWVYKKINTEKAMYFLKNYKWSSFHDYFGEGNKGSIINKDLFFNILDTDKKSYMEEITIFMADETEKIIPVNLAG